MPSEDLPVAELAFPGPLRDQLAAAIVTGRETHHHRLEPGPVMISGGR